MGTLAWIGLGSNLGDRKATLDEAVAALIESPSVVVEAVSTYRQTKPIGGPEGQGLFLNAAARVRTTLGPRALLSRLHQVEHQAGRVRDVRWGARTLDLDLLLYGCKYLNEPDLKLPHPRLGLRRFVLEPLAEIAPTIVDVVSKQTVAGLLANLDRRPRYVTLHGGSDALRDAVCREIASGLLATTVESPVSSNSHDLLAARIAVLDARTWEATPPADRWLVSDFCLAKTAISPWPRGEPEPGRLREVFDRYHELQARRCRAIHPTFGIWLVGDARPSATGFAWLRPDSFELSTIVAEALTTCQGIE